MRWSDEAKEKQPDGRAVVPGAHMADRQTGGAPARRCHGRFLATTTSVPPMVVGRWGHTATGSLVALRFVDNSIFMALKSHFIC